MGLVSGPLIALYKRLAISPKLGIQILQNPAIPKKEQSYSVMALILSCDNCLDPGVKICPK